MNRSRFFGIVASTAATTSPSNLTSNCNFRLFLEVGPPMKFRVLLPLSSSLLGLKLEASFKSCNMRRRAWQVWNSATLRLLFRKWRGNPLTGNWFSRFLDFPQLVESKLPRKFCWISNCWIAFLRSIKLSNRYGVQVIIWGSYFCYVHVSGLGFITNDWASSHWF